VSSRLLQIASVRKSINSSNNHTIPREEMELMSTKKDDGQGSDEEEDNLDNTMIMVIIKMYKSNNFCSIKWIVQWAGSKGKSWLFSR
jgi:hypothetical protein